MPIEDTDDKVRRNVVVASALTLLGVFLELPLSAIGDRLLGSSASAPLDARRIWIVVLLLLLYVGWRYWFSDTRLTSWAFAKIELELFRKNLARRVVQRAARRFTRTGRDSPTFADVLSKRCKARSAEFATINGGRPTLIFKSFQQPDWTVGRADADVEYGASPGTDTALNEQFHFSLPKWTRRRVRAVSLCALLVISKTCTGLFVPVALWIPALGVAVYKIYSS